MSPRKRRTKRCRRETRKRQIRELQSRLAQAALMLMQERALTGRLTAALESAIRRAARAEVSAAGCRCPTLNKEPN